MTYAQEDPIDAANRQTASLAGLAMTLLLVVICLYLVDTMRGLAEANPLT